MKSPIEVCGADSDKVNLLRTVGRYKVLVRSPPREDAGFWRTVPLTTNLDAVTWLS